jgi:MinD superfamily P-loop ATPase
VETVRELNIPFGIVLNRAGVGDAGVEEYCRKENIPVLLTIPLDTEIARLYSKGVPLVEGMPEWKDSFVQLFDRIGEMVDERNRSLKR